MAFMAKIEDFHRRLNDLDEISPEVGGIRVSFFADEMDKEFNRATVILNLPKKFDYKKACVALSSYLPTKGWLGYAQAYKRAEEFVRLHGLEDC